MKSKTMEYQTARDLPFAEAGTKVELSLSEGCIPMSLYNIKDCEVTISKEFIGQLISEGWIEPIKPREWYEVETQRPDGTWSALSYLRYYDKQGARDAVCRCEMNARFIKVREVIQ